VALHPLNFAITKNSRSPCGTSVVNDVSAVFVASADVPLFTDRYSSYSTAPAAGVHENVTFASEVMVLASGPLGCGAWLLQFGPCGTVKESVGENVDSQPSNSASTNHRTTPGSRFAVNWVSAVSPMVSDSAPSTAFHTR
jgi:hypothetical protein